MEKVKATTGIDSWMELSKDLAESFDMLKATEVLASTDETTPMSPVSGTYRKVEEPEAVDSTTIQEEITEMVQIIEEIQEKVEPVIQQPKTIVINGKEINIAWPQ